MIDLTKVINESLETYPGDPKVSLKQISTLSAGYNDYQLSINMHTGTHIDGINHMIKGPLISDIPLDRFIGKGRLIDEDFIYQDEEVFIINTDTYLSSLFVDKICSYPIKFIVLPINSVDAYPYDLHKRLFSHRIMIVENAANLDLLSKDNLYEVYAIPLKIEADSSLIRLFAKVIK